MRLQNKLWVLGLVLTCLASCYVKQAKKINLFEYTSEIYASQKLPLLSHQGPGRWDNYLTLNLPFQPVNLLRKDVEVVLKHPLKHRGEAHITVITPIEYWEQLKPILSIEELETLAKQSRLQDIPFRVQCLGQGHDILKKLNTYYLVVHSEELIKFRVKVWEYFKQKGGGTLAFNPLHYHPHITLGFDKRDLHLSDGVIKNEASCPEQWMLRKVNPTKE